MSHDKKVNIGIVIPNHNYSKWVAGSIASAVNEPYSNKTIVVIDDGSNDASWPIICKKLNLESIESGKPLFGKIDNIDTVGFRFNEAGGPSRARNKGIELIKDKVELFGFLDSDDKYLPGKITKSVDKYMQDPDRIGGIYTDYIIEDEQGRTRIEYKEPFSRERLVRECIIHSACIVSKKAIETCGNYDEEMRTCEDYDLWMRISEQYCFIHIPEPLMLVRVGNYNSTATVPAEIWNKNWHRVMQKAQARLNG